MVCNLQYLPKQKEGSQMNIYQTFLFPVSFIVGAGNKWDSLETSTKKKQKNNWLTEEKIKKHKSMKIQMGKLSLLLKLTLSFKLTLLSQLTLLLQLALLFQVTLLLKLALLFKSMLLFQPVSWQGYRGCSQSRSLRPTMGKLIKK